MKGIAVLGAAVVLACGPAAAAPPKKAAPTVEPPMQVQVVRGAHPGCEPECPQWIAAQGRIVAGTAAKFRKVLGQLGERKLPVLIDSGGGSVDDALAIGRLIRAKGLRVAVTKTAIMPCAPDDAACRKAKTGQGKTSGELRGVAQARFSKCASSCAFLLAGGTDRLVGPGTGVGVHQISMTLRRYLVWTRRSFGVPVERQKTLVSEQTVYGKNTDGTYARIRRYFSEMGIGEEAMSLIMSTPNWEIRWLTRQELQATRLATHFINGEELVTGVPASSPALAAPPQFATPGLSELMRYQGICEQPGMCEKGAATANPRFDLPGFVPKAPSAVPPASEAPKLEQRGSGAK